MSLQHIALDQIKEADLQQLVTDSARESRVIEYKRDWKLADESEKKEFLADVGSFANAGGGDLIYGIEAKDGVPVNLVGLSGFVSDQEQLKVEQLLKQWIAPRLGGVSFATVPLASAKAVFIIRVPRSWSPPHMVTCSGVNRFYSRHSNGKYQLDVNELRAAFLGTAQAGTRLRDFRIERVGRIAANEGAVKLASSVCYVLHLLPITEWSEYSYAKVIQQGSSDLLPMVMGIRQSHCLQANFDGLLFKTTIDGANSSNGYLQLFRNGAIEGVMCAPPSNVGNKVIDPQYQIQIRAGLKRYVNCLKTLDLPPPYLVGLSLLNVGGFTMKRKDTFDHLGETIQLIDRPNLVLPSIVIEGFDTNLDDLLYPAFEMVWNACGYAHALPPY